MSIRKAVFDKALGRGSLVGRLPLTHIVTITVFAVFTLLLAFSTYRSVSLRLEADRNNIIEQARRDVALLVRHAEVGLDGDNSLLKEELGYITSDPRITHTAIIDETGTVQLAKDYAWHDKPISRFVTATEMDFIEKARKTRLLVTNRHETAEHTTLLAMSYVTPQQQHHLRTIERGVIFMVCNLDMVRQQALGEALDIAAVDGFLLTLLLVVLLVALHAFVTRPLRQIVAYSKQEQTTSDNAPLILSHAPADLHELADAICNMRTALQRQLVELREKSELNNSILDNTDDGFITLTTKGVIVAVSRSVTTVFGYESEEMIGANVSMLMPSPDREKHDSYLERFQRTRIPITLGRRREVSGRHKNGTIFPLELRVSAITREGELLYVGSVRDITERKRLEQAKNEFVSVVSHELRTPLTAINGALGLILGTVRSQLTPTPLNLIEIAHRNGLRLLALINDLLDMEKMMAGKLPLNMSPHAVTPLVRYSVELLASYGREHHVEMTFESDTDALIRVDSDRMTQAIANLLSNAIKFSPTGGLVQVKVEQKNGRIRIGVRDQGPGIPESFRSRIFEKFAQADSTDTRQKGGTGLGLAISRELVERMGGSIGFDTEIGHGTEFFVEFAEAAVAPAEAAAKRA